MHTKEKHNYFCVCVILHKWILGEKKPRPRSGLKAADQETTASTVCPVFFVISTPGCVDVCQGNGVVQGSKRGGCVFISPQPQGCVQVRKSVILRPGLGPVYQVSKFAFVLVDCKPACMRSPRAKHISHLHIGRHINGADIEKLEQRYPVFGGLNKLPMLTKSKQETPCCN